MIYFKVLDNQLDEARFEKASEADLIEWASEIMSGRAEAEEDELGLEFAETLKNGVSFEYALHVIELWDYTVEIHTDLVLVG